MTKSWVLFGILGMVGASLAGCSDDGGSSASTLAPEPESVTAVAGEPGASIASDQGGEVVEETFAVDDVRYRISIPAAWNDGEGGWQVGPPDGPDASQVWARLVSGYTSFEDYLANYVPPAGQVVDDSGTGANSSGQDVGYLELSGVQPETNVGVRSYVVVMKVGERGLVLAFETTQTGWEKYGAEVVAALDTVDVQ